MEQAVWEGGDSVWAESSVALSLVAGIAHFRDVQPLLLRHTRQCSLLGWGREGEGRGRGREGKGGEEREGEGRRTGGRQNRDETEHLESGGTPLYAPPMSLRWGHSPSDQRTAAGSLVSPGGTS